jgi:hypothetical protein
VTSPKILILEDDEMWLARHKLRLMEAGFQCYATQDAKEAIKAAKTDPAIKFVLLDEILYVFPFPIKEEERELQRWQGSGVIREITAQRSDIQFIVISAAPQLASDEEDGDRQIFRRETQKLRRRLGVIDIVHKIDIEESPNDTYGWIIDLLKRSQVTTKAEVVTPKILIGLGFAKEAHEAMAEQMEVTRKKFLPITPLLKKAGTPAVLDEFFRKAEEKAVFLEMPGSKKLEPIKEIKPSSSAFRILSFLALQTEKQAEIIIRDGDYKHSRRKTKQAISVDPDYDAVENRDFAIGYDDEGRKGLRSGVQIEGKADQNSPLKVAIHRLSKQLHDLNVGPARQLFNFVEEGYQPSFELGVVCYAIRSNKKAR